MAHQVEQRRLAKEFEADQRVTVKQDTAEGAISPRVQKMRQRAEQRREARQRKARRQDDLRYTDVCRGDLLVNARRIMSVVNFLQEIRGLVMFALFFAMYFAHTTRVLDSTRGLETLSWIADAATTSNRYESLGTVDALVDWSVQDLYQMMRQVHEYCPKCLLGLSIIDRDLRVLTLKQMVCSDFDFPKTSLTGRQLIGEGSQVSFSPRDCAKENDRWAKQPVVESAPCCNSRDELALASLTLLALDLNVETPTMPLDKLRELETRTSALDSYVRSTLDMAAPLVQLIVLMPDAHALGITFTANWRDPVNLPKRILTERAYWSYYYEPKPVFLLVAIAFCVLSTLHEVFEQWGMAHTAHDAVRNVFSPFMLLIELPSIILPWVCEASAYALRLPDYAIAVAIIELLMFARVFQEGQVLPPFRIVVRTLIFAMPQLAWFTTAMVTTVCVFAGISKQLFGTVDSATSQYGDAFISMFSVAISGQASDGPAFALRPFSANLMFVVVNIFLFLIIAQFFIAILVGAFDETRAREEARIHEIGCPEGCVDVAEARTVRQAVADHLLYAVAYVQFGRFAPNLIKQLNKALDEAEERGAAAAEVLGEAYVAGPVLLTRAQLVCALGGCEVTAERLLARFGVEVLHPERVPRSVLLCKLAPGERPHPDCPPILEGLEEPPPMPRFRTKIEAHPMLAGGPAAPSEPPVRRAPPRVPQRHAAMVSDVAIVTGSFSEFDSLSDLDARQGGGEHARGGGSDGGEDARSGGGVHARGGDGEHARAAAPPPPSSTGDISTSPPPPDFTDDVCMSPPPLTAHDSSDVLDRSGTPSSSKPGGDCSTRSNASTPGVVRPRVVARAARSPGARGAAAAYISADEPDDVGFR